MFRVFGPGLVGFLVLAFWIYCVLDVIATEETFIRNLPKLPWLFLVLLFGPIGCIAWLLLGRPQYAGWRPGGETQIPPQYRSASPPVRGPEDAPGFSIGRSEEERAQRDRERQERLQRWEEDRRRREQGNGHANDERDNGTGEVPPPPSS